MTGLSPSVQSSSSISAPITAFATQPPIAPVTELAKYDLAVTPGENKRGFLLALTAVAGDLIGSIHAGLLYILSPADAGGIGATLGTTATWGVFGIVNSLTAILTIPITMLAHRSLMMEGRTLEAAIKRNEENRRVFHEDLFLELLRLRCLLNENDFTIQVKELGLENDEIHSAKLIALVKEIYKNPAFQANRYTVNPENFTLAESKLEKQEGNSRPLPAILITAELERNPTIHSEIRNTLTHLVPEFTNQLNACYKPIPPPRDRRKRAALYGVAGGIAIFGGVLGINGTLTGLLLLGGCAALPGIGWGLLGLACLATAIYCGILIARIKDKNFRRKDVEKQTRLRSDLLEEVKTKVHNTAVRVHEKNPEAHALKVYPAEITHIVDNAIRPVAETCDAFKRDLGAAKEQLDNEQAKNHKLNEQVAALTAKKQAVEQERDQQAKKCDDAAAALNAANQKLAAAEKKSEEAAAATAAAYRRMLESKNSTTILHAPAANQKLPGDAKAKAAANVRRHSFS
jgi:hypothetical protein